MRATAAVVAILALAAPPAGAQASPYLPLDDPGYVYFDALVSRGALRGIGLLERPVTIAAIRRALAATDTTRLGAIPRRWVQRLDDRLQLLAPARRARDSSGVFALNIAPGLRAVAQTSGQRNLMLGDATSGVYPGASLSLAANAGNVVGVARLQADNRLRDDPEFAGKKDRWVRGRMEDAYVSAQWPLGELFYGRLTRNWGPPSLQGAHVGSAPYSYDHLGARLGPDRLHLSTLLARLDPMPAIGSGLPAPVAQRYFAIHRLAGRIGSVELAASESYLYSGAGRGMSFSISNPLNLYDLAQYNEGESGNVAYSLDAAWRGAGGAWVAGQFFLDDVQVDDCVPLCQEPSSWAATLALEGLPFGSSAHRVFASYTRVTNLVYRTPDPTELYASFGVSLGRAFTDYDELRGGVDLALLAAAPVRVYMAHRRQGEGDYRLPFPAPAEYAFTPGFLAGDVRRVYRLGLEGGVSAGDVSALWDLGANPWRGARQFEGRVIVRWEPSWARIGGLFHD